MKRTELEHIIRAAAAITGTQRFVIVGSQAILGQFPSSPEELLLSAEADLAFPEPVHANLIDGTIGEGSPFHQTFGYYGHGVAESVAILPDGWKTRLVSVHNQNTGAGTGLCLEIHDLAISKLVAAHEKDMNFIQALQRHRLIDPTVMEKRLGSTPISDEDKNRCRTRLKRLGNPP